MRHSVMSLSDAAASRVREVMASGGLTGVRVGVKKGGCAGMEYTVAPVTEPDPRDELVEADGARVFVDRAAVLFLLGSRMDFETSTFRTGFTFTNPNQVSACGCGESVELKPAAA